MDSVQISFKNKRTLIEPIAFVSIAFFAGHTRLIECFPGATKGGLIFTGIMNGIGSCIHDYKYNKKEPIFFRKVAAIALASMISGGLTKTLKGNIYLSFNNTRKIAGIGCIVVLFKEVVELETVNISNRRSLAYLVRDHQLPQENNESEISKEQLIKGSKNQFKFGREICSGATLAFLEAVLKKEYNTIRPPIIDSILTDGLEIYSKGLKLKQNGPIIQGVSQIDSQSRQLHPIDLLEFTTLKGHRSPESKILKDERGFKDFLKNLIEVYLVPLAQRENKIGMTMTFNGKTYAISIEIQDDIPQFVFFDSHGHQISDHMAYIYKTNEIIEFTSFIARIVEFISRKVEGGETEGLTLSEVELLSMPQDGDNEIGCFIVG